LAAIIEQCNENGLLSIKKPQSAADLIFVLVDGAYFYLSLEGDAKAYEQRLGYYKQKAYEVLGIPQLAVS